MNLDEFKSVTKGVTAPRGTPSSDTNLDSFITKMRSRDQQERRRLMGMALIYLSVGIVFTGAPLSRQPASGLIGAGIVLVALFAGLKGRWFGRVDYAAPTRDFLAAAERRYQFWRATDVLYVIPLLLVMVVGGGLTVWQIAQKYFSQPHIPLVLAAYGLFVVSVAVFGFVQGRKVWRQKSAGFLEEIQRRQQELQNG